MLAWPHIVRRVILIVAGLTLTAVAVSSVWPSQGWTSIPVTVPREPCLPYTEQAIFVSLYATGFDISSSTLHVKAQVSMPYISPNPKLTAGHGGETAISVWINDTKLTWLDLNRTATATLKLDGSSNSFPFDHYDQGITGRAQGAGGYSFIGNTRAEKSGAGIRYPVYFMLQSELDDWRFEGMCGAYIFDKHGYLKFDPNQDGDSVEIKLVRHRAFSIYVLAICILPLLIALAFAYRRFPKFGGRRDDTSPLELASALLTLLALRQVLVPGDLVGLTVIDRILGVELSIVVLLTLWAYLAESKPANSK